MTSPAENAALTFALASAVGIAAQSVARTLRIPGIVLLLFAGVALGPDFAGLIHPEALGSGMSNVVGFSVSVILFEGGMNLKIEEFRGREIAIRRLISVGAIITMLGGTLVAYLVMGWSLRTAFLFGALVIVTGPTVVTPLVRRFRLEHTVGTILEAEGVLIDAIGAVIAVVALEIAIEPSGLSVAKGALHIVTKLGLGMLLGLIGGILIWLALRYRWVIASGLENVFTLAMVWALYQIADAVQHESGIAAATVAGLVVGNRKHPNQRTLLEFNDQLTVMLIGILFVLLAADVRVADVQALGVRGVMTVVLLIVLVRPLDVFISTYDTTLSTKQKAFIAFIGPRGIIAAAVASLFATRLSDAGLGGGAELKALVFLVIAATVVLAGLTGGFVAGVAKLRRDPHGWVVLGANPLAILFAQLMKKGGQETVLIDSSVDHCVLAEAAGVKTVRGNALQAETLHHADVSARVGAAALTPNDEINLLFIEKVKEEGRVTQLAAALRSATMGATTEMVHRAGGSLLFAGDYDSEMWGTWVQSGRGVARVFEASATGLELGHQDGSEERYVPLVVRTKQGTHPVTDRTQVSKFDLVTFVIDSRRETEAVTQLERRGFTPVAADEPPEPAPEDGAAGIELPAPSQV
ncbi:MAG: sodium:proton antiporter [Myxococcota bacterium]